MKENDKTFELSSCETACRGDGPKLGQEVAGIDEPLQDAATWPRKCGEIATRQVKEKGRRMNLIKATA